MDIKTFKERCESVILVDDLPSLSKLRQKVAGCYSVFGICPKEGEVIALDMVGRVNCLKAEIQRGTRMCEEDGLPCDLEAEPRAILSVIRLLRDFVVENFVTKEGTLPDKKIQKSPSHSVPPRPGMSDTFSGGDYADEDRGISPHLTEKEKRKRRRRVEAKERKKKPMN